MSIAALIILGIVCVGHVLILLRQSTERENADQRFYAHLRESEDRLMAVLTPDALNHVDVTRGSLEERVQNAPGVTNVTYLDDQAEYELQRSRHGDDEEANA